jgi:hypothetical protein
MLKSYKVIHRCRDCNTKFALDELILAEDLEDALRKAIEDHSAEIHPPCAFDPAAPFVPRQARTIQGPSDLIGVYPE